MDQHVLVQYPEILAHKTITGGHIQNVSMAIAGAMQEVWKSAHIAKMFQVDRRYLREDETPKQEQCRSTNLEQKGRKLQQQNPVRQQHVVFKAGETDEDPLLIDMRENRPEYNGFAGNAYWDAIYFHTSNQ